MHGPWEFTFFASMLGVGVKFIRHGFLIQCPRHTHTPGPFQRSGWGTGIHILFVCLFVYVVVVLLFDIGYHTA